MWWEYDFCGKCIPLILFIFREETSEELQIPTILISKLTGAELFKDIKPTWLSIAIEEPPISSSYKDSTALLGVAFKLKNPNLSIQENICSHIKSSDLSWIIYNGSNIIDNIHKINYIHVHIEGNITTANKMDIICRMNISGKLDCYITNFVNGITHIYFVTYCELISEVYEIILIALREVKEGRIRKTPESSKNLQSLMKEECLKMNLLFCFPSAICLFKEICYKENSINIILNSELDIELEVSSISLQSLDIIKSASLCLITPANKVLIFVANSIFGKVKGNISSIPVCYLLTGVGFKIEREIKTAIGNVIETLENNGVKVLSISADTAFHPILLKPWRQNSGSFDVVEELEENDQTSGSGN